MLAANVDSAGRSGAKGSLVTILILCSLTLVTSLTGENRNPHDPFWSASRLSENTTSSAVSGDPSENLTFGRSSKVADRPSLATFQDVASSGSGVLPSAPSFTSRS